ncbi:MAG: neutral/alkaline non-lysosomal ceramidase N-terminal domain-containing protein [Deltaproteobacteria bacterium]|nr:neutral/alkaline non-lysosomal ceramidase N-terminal domain-containing protein [Deltaproteobacteria bacterium]
MDLPLAGYSFDGKLGSRVAGRLFAHALYLEDATGAAAAWVICDLHSASRYLHEKVAAATASIGIGVGQLMLSGTHTHTGPGNYYGNSLYDFLAQPHPGFNRTLADLLASRIARAVRLAKDASGQADVGWGLVRLWGVSRNRSQAAFERNAEASNWSHSAVGGGAPPGLDLDQIFIDPRVRVLTAVARPSGRPLAVFATFGCHATSMGPTLAAYSPDWPGVAVREVSAQLQQPGVAAPVVAVGLSGAGDVTPLPPTGEQGAVLADDVGQAVARAIVTVVPEAVAVARPFHVDTRWHELHVRERYVPGFKATTLLAQQWAFGASVLAGAEDARTEYYRIGLVREGMTGNDFATSSPQYPKARALGPLQPFLRGAGNFSPSPALPLHAFRVGDTWLVTVPGEPTTVAAHRIELAVRAATGDHCVVVGYSGDYSGYFTTEQEYRAQHYEGASTLWGRHSTEHIRRQYERLLGPGGTSTPVARSKVAFNTIP